jgi:acetyl esterase/lipase
VLSGKRAVTVITYGVAVPLILVPALGVLCTFLYRVPYIGQVTSVVPWYLSWLMAAALIGGAMLVGRARGSRPAAALVVIAVLALVGGAVITARMTTAVQRAGADINLVETFGVGVPRFATPDAVADYGSFEGNPLRLSIYRPSAQNADSPVLMSIHGGGWIAGDRDADSADLRWFADQGWLTISVDYSLSSSDRHLWDVTQGQIACAMAWVAQNAVHYGGDPTRLSLTGDSAGGNLAINAAYMAANKTLRSDCGGTIPQVSAVSAAYPAVDPAGAYANDDPVLGKLSREISRDYTGGSPEQFPQRYTQIASATHISSDAPPTLMIVPEADHIVPVAGAYQFADAATAAGVDVELVVIPYADHSFQARAGNIGQQAYRQLTARWLRDHDQAP